MYIHNNDNDNNNNDNNSNNDNMYTYTYAYIYIYIYVYIDIDTHTHTIRIYIYIYRYTHVYVYTYLFIYLFIGLPCHHAYLLEQVRLIDKKKVRMLIIRIDITNKIIKGISRAWILDLLHAIVAEVLRRLAFPPCEK